MFIHLCSLTRCFSLEQHYPLMVFEEDIGCRAVYLSYDLRELFSEEMPPTYRHHVAPTVPWPCNNTALDSSVIEEGRAN
jgi:hypothetical protein